MFNFLASLLTGIANNMAFTSSSACVYWWVDEPTCPKSLIK